MSQEEIAKLKERLTLVLKEMGEAIRSRFAGHNSGGAFGGSKGRVDQAGRGTSGRTPAGELAWKGVASHALRRLLLVVRRLLRRLFGLGR